ncbi:MAG: peptidoglycan bridge formation glycyltransferase FemA/FemB family protein [Lentimicrobium sp.]|jgi:lipid II:glycine glycyltransferase (peptidoglycan interpeptide bridge formation enzyme)|nr:peptidoglycan bridge formation glycyltransferase FemA/FemB family protein [Lentimicrobium sp.]
MNLLKVIPKVTKDILPSNILQQTAFWARFKHQLGWQPQAFDIFEPDAMRYGYWVHKGDILITLKELKNGKIIAYAPYGPEIIPDNEVRGLWLETLSEELRKYLPPECFVIRFDLHWPSPWHENELAVRGSTTSIPDAPIQEMRMNIGTKNWNLQKSATNVLPSNTVILPLNTGPDEILAQMKPKTRYNIRLSRKKDIEIKISDINELDRWYGLYQETVKRNRIVSEEKDYFRRVLATRAEDTISPAEIILLLVEFKGQPLAGMFLALSGKRATYLYGASSNRYREFMAPYFLQWNAIQLSKENGCSEYDFFGISGSPDPSHPMYGLYRFKTGFGGYIRHRLGCWDYPLKQDSYEKFRTHESLSTGFHLQK